MTVQLSKTLSILINRDPETAYAFLSVPENFPQWASGLGKLQRDGKQWIAQTPDGPMRVRFSPRNDYGVLDHWVYPDADSCIYIPMRLLANGDGCELLFTLFRQPGMTDEKFAADADWVRRDLQALRDLLEKTPGTTP